MSNLNLAIIGNGSIGLLLNDRGEIVWGCYPGFDGDALFCALLQDDGGETGLWAVDVLDLERVEQHYLTNTAVVVTRLYDQHGGIVEITDLVPRFHQFGRIFCPMSVVRRIRRIAGSPRIAVRLRMCCDWGEGRPQVSCGSNHIRYVAPSVTLRLTTDASITAVLQESPFFLNDDITFILGPDETLPASPRDTGNHYEAETIEYWQSWVRGLAIPFEWQNAVIRAAITLKLNTCEDTGAIIAALTTSIPEAAGGERNWDYRYCWLRDAYFTVNALNRLGTTQTMENYLNYIINVAACAPEGRLQPVYRIDGQPALDERIVTGLDGYRGMGPVRVGNLAYIQVQNDVYGSAVLAATHLFFDRRIQPPQSAELFHRLEHLGEMAHRVFDQPDAGLWELRGTSRIHTFSSVMCWVAADRLAKIARHLGLTDRAGYWQAHADRMHDEIMVRAWDAQRGVFSSVFDGEGMDGSLLLLPELHFISAQDPRFLQTMAAVEQDLRRGDYIYRYREADDFGVPENAFLVCTFWYIDALAVTGRMEEARRLFENMISRRNTHGLLAEHIDPQTGELWGNFVQTYSMVGLINSAQKLSVPWEKAF